MTLVNESTNTGGETARLVCPNCGSSENGKDGKTKRGKEVYQRRKCKLCGKKYSAEILSTQNEYDIRRVSDKNESKNLIVAQDKVGATGNISETEKLLLEFIFHMKKRGLAEPTIERRHRHLKVLAKRGADLLDPESVKLKISEQDWVGNSKNRACDTYNDFLSMIGKTWVKPKYTAKETLPFIPTETEIDSLIAGCRIEEAALLQLAKETALRKGEALGATWEDIDLETSTIRISPEKGSRPRITKLSFRCLSMLLEAKRKHGTNKLYAKKSKTFDRNLANARSKIAYNTQNDRIRRITFHTLRHWKATMLYHQTKDIVYVQQFLGHKTINHTLKYIQLAEALFHDVSNFTVKTAKTPEEAIKLLEQGFQKSDEFDGLHLYRKPK